MPPARRFADSRAVLRPSSDTAAALLAELASDPTLARPRPLALGRVLAGATLDLGGLDLSESVLMDIIDGLAPPLAPAALLLDDQALGPGAIERLGEALVRVRALDRLSLAGAPLGERGLRALVGALARRPTPLRALDLADAALDGAALVSLAAALPDLGVAHLALGRAGSESAARNHLDDAAADALATALPSAARLVGLDLRGIDTTEAAIARLVAPIVDGRASVMVRLDPGLLDAPLQARLMARLAHLANTLGAAARPPVALAALRDGADTRPPRARPDARPPELGADASGRPPLDPADVAAFTRIADALERWPELLHDPALRPLADRLLRLRRDARSEARRRSRRGAARETALARDRAAIEATGIRQRRRRGETHAPPPPMSLETGEEALDELSRARPCYVCKRPYSRLHPFYDRLCPACGERSYARRLAAVDLRGRVALVTGGRIKIGHAVARRLLAWGARVIVTTRFPRDAARRFAADPALPDDAAERLEIHGLDLRDLPALEAFCAMIRARHRRLDVLVNNAAQTIRRPPAFYADLLALEAAPLDALEPPLRRLLAPTAPAGEPASAAALALARADELFPPGSDDGFGQPEDHRETNSWRLRLDEVSTIEAVEVQLVSALAPFVLCARLRAAMARPGSDDAAFIVNVAAPEGQFYRPYKAPFHPHTNMAKAGLNMITRTSAEDYASDRIFMTSVDTGWASNENPRPIAEAMRARGFAPPLDEVDAATRICDPIARGLGDGELLWGVLLKDFEAVPW